MLRAIFIQTIGVIYLFRGYEFYILLRFLDLAYYYIRENTVLETILT
jgi:hypothetical protein